MKTQSIRSIPIMPVLMIATLSLIIGIPTFIVSSSLTADAQRGKPKTPPSTTSASVALPLTTMPFGTTITLPDGSTGAYDAAVVNTNRWGEWYPSLSGSYTASPGDYVQFLGVGSSGWIGCTLRVGSSGELLRTKHDDPTYRLDSAWCIDPLANTWRPGFVRTSKPDHKMMGAYYNQVWPAEAAITIVTNNSRLYVRSTGSPSRAVTIRGSGNVVDVVATQGEQSNNQLDFGAVYVEGSSNTVTGYADGKMAAVFFKGPLNRAVNVVGLGAEIGDDVGVFYVRKESNGAVFDRCTAIRKSRYIAPSHGVQGFYIDDRSSGASLTNCAAFGFDTTVGRGVFVHGGNDTKVSGFLSYASGIPVKVVPHFTTPTILPTGTLISSVTEIK